jgi:beta-galactosidase
VHVAQSFPSGLEEGAAGTDWVDVLHVDDAVTLLAFDTWELGTGAALTSKSFGRGRVSYLATVPNPPLARSIGRWLVEEPASAAWHAPREVTVSTGTSGARRLAFVSNWSGEASTVIAPTGLTDLTTGVAHAPGARIVLGPRDARIFEVTSDR